MHGDKLSTFLSPSGIHDIGAMAVKTPLMLWYSDPQNEKICYFARHGLASSWPRQLKTIKERRA